MQHRLPFYPLWNPVTVGCLCKSNIVYSEHESSTAAKIISFIGYRTGQHFLRHKQLKSLIQVNPTLTSWLPVVSNMTDILFEAIKFILYLLLIHCIAFIVLPKVGEDLLLILALYGSPWVGVTHLGPLDCTPNWASHRQGFLQRFIFRAILYSTQTHMQMHCNASRCIGCHDMGLRLKLCCPWLA